LRSTNQHLLLAYLLTLLNNLHKPAVGSATTATIYQNLSFILERLYPSSGQTTANKPHEAC